MITTNSVKILIIIFKGGSKLIHNVFIKTSVVKKTGHLLLSYLSRRVKKSAKDILAEE